MFVLRTTMRGPTQNKVFKINTAFWYYRSMPKILDICKIQNNNNDLPKKVQSFAPFLCEKHLVKKQDG